MVEFDCRRSPQHRNIATSHAVSTLSILFSFLENVLYRREQTKPSTQMTNPLAGEVRSVACYTLFTVPWFLALRSCMLLRDLKLYSTFL